MRPHSTKSLTLTLFLPAVPKNNSLTDTVFVGNNVEKEKEERKLASTNLAAPTAVIESIQDHAISRRKSYADAVKKQNKAVSEVRYEALVPRLSLR